ncbi:MAG: YdcF family protein [Candidatus Microsaccharimonas sp.]
MKWLIITPIVLIVSILGLSIYLQPNSFIGCDTKPVSQTQCDKADAIVVVSGGDTEARTAAGINLYQNGWANYLVLSGAAFDKTGPSNAATMKLQALQAGVPISAIIIDEESVNTQQNAVNSQTIFEAEHLKDVILVTSGYHQRRVSLEFHTLASDGTIRNYPVTNDKDWGFFWWLTPRGWWLVGGEIVKIIAFYLGVRS